MEKSGPVFETLPQARIPFKERTRRAGHETRGTCPLESPVLLRELPLPDKTKAFIRVLKNPRTGGVVYVIGTSHLTKASQDDVRMLIEAVKPDVVAVEVSTALWLWNDD
jgi:hypothetical protein